LRKPRVLVSCFPQSGHLHPLIPTARALVDAGCPLLVATSSAQHATLAAAGLAAVDVGPSYEDTVARLGDARSEALAAAPAARRAILFSHLFGRLYAAQVADDLFEQTRSWGADVLVSGLESLAGPLVV
jgi:UDP:flavonoid glycosyltransferase YjiC (YdhE family)